MLDRQIPELVAETPPPAETIVVEKVAARLFRMRDGRPLDANRNRPSCAKKNGPTDCAVDDCWGRGGGKRRKKPSVVVRFTR